MTTHVQVVGWNQRACLAVCLRSCLNQTVSAPVLYVDNASVDRSVEFVRTNFPTVRILANARNRGYSGGHNDGLRAIADTDIVVVLNPDVELAPDFVERGLSSFGGKSTGAVVPLLFSGRKSGVGDRVVDAYGTVLRWSLRAVNQFEGQSLSNLRSPISNFHPWGFTGAAVFLRRRALADVALDGEVFDEDLFAYREDIDLSWRLRLRGWEIVGAPGARATHVRSARPDKPRNPQVARLSWRNYFLVLIKDVPARTLFRHAPWVFLESLARSVQVLVTFFLWPALPELVRLLPKFLEKRRRVLTRASAAPYAVGNRGREAERFCDGKIDFF